MWVLVYDARPWTVNAERRMHWRRHGALVEQWRTAYTWLARSHRIPPCDAIQIDATPLWPNRRSVPDPGNTYPAVKAAIDGLVDAGVIPTDTDRHVHRLTFHPTLIDPQRARHGLNLTITRSTTP